MALVGIRHKGVRQIEADAFSVPNRKVTQRQSRRDAIVQVAAGYFLEHGYCRP